MVTVNNPTGTVMAIPERRAVICARRFDSGISDRHCVIIDGPFCTAHRRRMLIGDKHFSPTVVKRAAGRGGIENARRGYRMCSALITHAPFDAARLDCQHDPLEIGAVLSSALR